MPISGSGGGRDLWSRASTPLVHLQGVQALLNQENINEAEHELSVDLANTGGFTDMSPELFYDTLDQLHQHQDTDAREETTKKKRKPPKNPILPDGTVKRGRPRKDQPGTSKRKREDLAEDGADGQARPSKRAKTVATAGDLVVEANQGTPVAEPPRGNAGVPPKRKPEGEPPATPTPRKRGRPPKTVPQRRRGNKSPWDGVEQTLLKPCPFGPRSRGRPGNTRDSSILPVLPYPEVLTRPVPTRAPPLIRASSGDSNPTPRAGIAYSEPRELAQTSQPEMPMGCVARKPVPEQFTQLFH
jgi:hypothetical protein